MTKKIWSLVWAVVVFTIVAQILLATLEPYFGMIKVALVAAVIIAVIYFIGKRARAVIDRR